jgi:ATP/maltotriose-dependent transcriptional regulator MalT
MRPDRAEIKPPVNIADLVGQLRARRAARLAARVAAGDSRAIAEQAAEQAAQERAEAAQRERDQREAARLRQLLDLDDVKAAPPRNRSPLTFRERDVSRAIAGHLKAGMGVARTEIGRDGRIVIVTGAPERTEIAPTSEANEWDEVLDDGHH